MSHTPGKLQDSPAGGTGRADEYEAWKTLRPYVGHCLTLNHEVNNSLTALLGYLEFLELERESLSVDQQEYLEHIREAADRIKGAVEQLSREKIELAEKIDLRAVTDSYRRDDCDQSR